MNSRRQLLAIPYVAWAVIFTIIPLVLVFFFAVFEKTADGYVFTTEHIMHLFEERDAVISSLGRSVKLSVISTLICLLLGYPLALILSRSTFKYKGLLVTLMILPMWMNFLIRTYAMLTLMETNGIINQFLGIFGIGPIQLLYREGSIVVGMVYNYLPFMVLPIHSVLVKLDNRVIEAAEDLGADRIKVFTKIILPLSLGGIMSGITMVFIPSITTFAISQILGGDKQLLIGDLIEKQFMEFNNWGYGALLAVIVVVVVLFCLYLSSKFGNDDDTGGLLG